METELEYGREGDAAAKGDSAPDRIGLWWSKVCEKLISGKSSMLNSGRLSKTALISTVSAGEGEGGMK